MCVHAQREQGYLATHIRAVHEGVKYPCSHCSNQFTSKGPLATHIRTVHEGGKYPCSRCGNQFTSKVHLDRHIRVVHEGVKYTCSNLDEFPIGTLKSNIDRTSLKWGSPKLGGPLSSRGSNAKKSLTEILN